MKKTKKSKAVLEMEQVKKNASYPDRLLANFPELKELVNNYNFNTQQSYVQLEHFLFSLSEYGSVDLALEDSGFGATHLFTLYGHSKKFKRLVGKLTKHSIERDYRLLKRYAVQGKEVYEKDQLVIKEKAPSDMNRVADFSLSLQEIKDRDALLNNSPDAGATMEDVYQGVDL